MGDPAEGGVRAGLSFWGLVAVEPARSQGHSLLSL